MKSQLERLQHNWIWNFPGLDLQHVNHVQLERRNSAKFLKNHWEKRRPHSTEQWAMHDLSKIKVPEGLDVTINKPNWHIMVDQLSGFKQSKFFVTKNEIINYMCQIMHLEAEQGYSIRILHQDNAGGNIKLVKMIKGKDWKLDFAVEYTA